MGLTKNWIQLKKRIRVGREVQKKEVSRMNHKRESNKIQNIKNISEKRDTMRKSSIFVTEL